MEAVVDVPNNYGEDDGLGGEQRGNYGTWNALDIRDIGNQPTQMWNGNLSWVIVGNQTPTVLSLVTSQWVLVSGTGNSPLVLVEVEQTRRLILVLYH